MIILMTLNLLLYTTIQIYVMLLSYLRVVYKKIDEYVLECTYVCMYIK